MKPVNSKGYFIVTLVLNYCIHFYDFTDNRKFCLSGQTPLMMAVLG